MKTKPLIVSVALVLLAGCSAPRALTDIGLSAGGAYLGHELSGGKAAATVAGAAGGVVIAEGLHYLAGKQTAKAYASGYDRGKSDAVKQQYWLYVAGQKLSPDRESVRLYPVNLPEQRIDGVTFQPTTKYLRIEE